MMTCGFMVIDVPHHLHLLTPGSFTQEGFEAIL